MTEQALSTWEQFRAFPDRLKAFAIGMGILVWAYWPNLQALWRVWSDDPTYSHGSLVIPIALWIFWRRLAAAPINWQAKRVLWWQLMPLGAILAVRIFAHERNSQWLETATIVPAVACLMLAIGGWPLLQRGWPAAVFLVFMLPLPQSVNNIVARPLQQIATVGSILGMKLTGLQASADGDVINLRDHANALKTLNVDLSHGGLSMVTTLAATVTAIVMLFSLANWKRFVVLASAIPIALISNILRIVAVGWCYYLIDGVQAVRIAHDWTGFMMMPLALILIFLELRALSWLAEFRRSSPKVVDRSIFTDDSDWGDPEHDFDA